MLDRLIIEATEYEFKVAVEKNKPKSWLKSVSAFANGIGGTLFLASVMIERSPVWMTHKPTLKQSADSSKIASRHWCNLC
mgnify:CR=1 FL=1